LQKIFPQKTKKKRKRRKIQFEVAKEKKTAVVKSDVRRFEQIHVNKGKHATEEAPQHTVHHARTQTSAKEKEKEKNKRKFRNICPAETAKMTDTCRRPSQAVAC
jgi:hypothetical protein